MIDHDSATTEPAPPDAADWHAANLEHLERAIASARGALERYAMQAARGGVMRPSPAQEPVASQTDRATAAPDDEAPTFALDALVARCDLTPFERDLLVLAVGAATSGEVAHVCGLAQQDPAKPFMTFGLALAALPGGHWSALLPERPLRHWSLLEVADGPGDGRPGLVLSRLVVPEPVLHFLLGSPTLDPALGAVLAPVEAPEAILPSRFRLARLLAGAWHDAADEAPVLHLRGDVDAAVEVAGAAAALAGLSLNRLPEPLLPRDAGAADRLGRLWRRDGALTGAVLLITLEPDAAPGGAGDSLLARFIAMAESTVIVAGAGRAEVQAPSGRPVVRLELPPPDPREIRAAWRQALGPAAAVLGERLDRLADQFRLPLATIRACARLALADMEPRSGLEGANDDDGSETFGRRLWGICREQGRYRLASLARRLPCRARLEDLVLPESAKVVLRQIVGHLRHRHRVLLEWGFERTSERGLGIGALFAGPSGTGKTMAAEVVAGELDLDLFRIDLSAVVNKYIGETEKNLRRVFDAAESVGAVLLFDEADALFGKRSEVRDSHDRYANVEVGYLLQRIEEYRGIAILTSNMPQALDTAFLRRLNYIVHFRFPDQAQRAEVWRHIYPPNTPTRGLAWDRLAQLSFSGGQIRTVALNAAYLAAEAGEPISMAHIAIAAQRVR